MPGKAIVAATEATLITQPPLPAAPPGRIARNACLMPSVVPSRLTSSILRRLGGVDVDQQAGDLDAGVVDQDVETAELADRVGDRGLPAGVVGDVEVHEPVAVAERSGHLGAEVVLQVADHHLGAGCGQRLGHALAESLGAAGDQCPAAGQVEICHGCSFAPRWLVAATPVAWRRSQPTADPLTTVKTSLDSCQEIVGRT